MKRITSLLLCLCLVFSLSTVVFAGTVPESESIGKSVISTSVPYSHTVTVSAKGADVMFNGELRESFTVERLSQPTLIVRAESGKSVKQVLLNGVDITSQIKGGYFTLEPVYEDKTLTVITEDEAVAPQSKTYTVKGTVNRDGKPVKDITLELRSTLKTDVTDRKGRFSFDDVECGKHSLTAIENGKIVGYVEFELTEGLDTDFSLEESGLYKVTANHDEIGIDLTLNLSDDDTMQITGVKGVEKSNFSPGNGRGETPKTGDDCDIFLYLTVFVLCIAALVIVVFKKKKLQYE
ncbi:MAG: hypothetical protein ACI4VW_00030 [Acutalibacteraceae bacterium]